MKSWFELEFLSMGSSAAGWLAAGSVQMLNELGLLNGSVRTLHTTTYRIEPMVARAQSHQRQMAPPIPVCLYFKIA